MNSNKYMKSMNKYDCIDHCQKHKSLNCIQII